LETGREHRPDSSNGELRIDLEKVWKAVDVAVQNGRILEIAADIDRGLLKTINTVFPLQ
jgi:hypothetical protein